VIEVKRWSGWREVVTAPSVPIWPSFAILRTNDRGLRARAAAHRPAYD
jgi:hypothetical protein